MPITKENFYETIEKYIKKIGQGTASDNSNCVYNYFDDIITWSQAPAESYTGATAAGKSALDIINSKARAATKIYCKTACYYFYECQKATHAGYPKTGLKLARLAIQLLRSLHYILLPASMLAPANYSSTWYGEGSGLWSPSARDAWKNHIADRYTNSSANGPYVRIREIVINETNTLEVETFIKSAPYPWGNRAEPELFSGGVNIMNIAAYSAKDPLVSLEDAIALAMVSSAYFDATGQNHIGANIGGVPMLITFLADAKTNAPSTTGVSAMDYMRIKDYIDTVDHAYNNAQTLKTIADNLHHGLETYEGNRKVYNAKKKMRFISSILDSIERAQSVLFNISAETKKYNDLFAGERGWMSLSVASVAADELSKQLTNIERLVDNIEQCEEEIIDNAQDSTASSIRATLTNMNATLASLSSSVRTNNNELNKVNRRIDALKESINDASVSNGEINITYNEPSDAIPAGINAYISTIRSAIYGSDMRDAIANAFDSLVSSVSTLNTNDVSMNAAIQAGLKAELIDTYFDWQSLTSEQKNANVIYIALTDNLMVYKSHILYFTDVNGGRTASFGSVSLSYGDIAYDLSIYGTGDMQASDEVINEIDLSENDKDKGGDE